ncbi:MAG: hypothetical protein KDJ78_14855, partial [Rhodobacteraceae bacterium]|nr:hypothetical protein [Paracoccaceae bacterium]
MGSNTGAFFADVSLSVPSDGGAGRLRTTGAAVSGSLHDQVLRPVGEAGDVLVAVLGDDED